MMNKARLRGSAALLACLLLAPVAMAQPGRASYTGEIQSNGRYVPAVTTFQPNGQGRIGGSYWYTQDKRNHPGILSDCEYDGDVSLTCDWHDEAGEGEVTFAFDARFQQFVGLWTSEEGDGVYGWSGKKSLKGSARK